MMYQKSSLILALLLAVGSAIEPSAANEDKVARSHNQSDNGNESALPEVPRTGTPAGHPTPGTTRPRAVCQPTDKPLTALLPDSQNSYTTSKYPSFWVYVPYSAKQIRYLEFVLLDGAETATIYRTGIEIAGKSGLIKISIPEEAQYALQINQDYHWYLMLSCQNNEEENDEPDLVVDGWVTRKPAQSQLTQWNYDAIASATEAHFARPEDEQITRDWQNLLTDLGYLWVETETPVEAKFLSLNL